MITLDLPPLSDHTISLHLANTRSGEYDPNQPLPYPLHCDPNTGRLKRQLTNLTQVIGFVEDPDEETVDLTWDEWADDSPGCDPGLVVGWFPVVCDTAGNVITRMLPIDHLSFNGKPLGWVGWTGAEEGQK